MLNTFDPSELKKLYKPAVNSSGEDNGQLTIIGGSKLFHGAPLFGLKVASRIVDMVFFATPEPSVGRVAEQLKSKLFNFIWVDWADTESYIAKSDAVLMGPGFMRFGSEKTREEEKDSLSHQEGILTKLITETFLKKFPNKKWVIDAGSLQVMRPEWIPKKAILTPNKREFELLFNSQFSISNFQINAKKYDCTIVAKGPETIVVSPDDCVVVKGGNPGLTKGGSGDVLSGLTASFLAKNDPFLSACAASYIEKAAADELYKKVGTNYNSDDLADKIPEVYFNLIK